MRANFKYFISSRRNPFELLVATKHSQATGFLYFDDGESFGKLYNFYKYLPMCTNFKYCY